MKIRKAQGNVFLKFSRAIAVLLVTSIALGSLGFTTIYAYRSDNITVFDTLYPLKQTMENWAIAATQNPVEKAELYLDLATKRSIEVQKQLELKQKIDPGTLTAIKDNNEKAVVAAQQITDQVAKRAMEQKIVAVSHTQVNTLKKVKADGIKLEATAKAIELQPIVTQDISLGTPNVNQNPALPTEDIKFGSIPSTFETIVAASPELSLVDTVITDTKKYTNEKIVAEQLGDKSSDTNTKPEIDSASGSTVLDHQLESVSLSSNSL